MAEDIFASNYSRELSYKDFCDDIAREYVRLINEKMTNSISFEFEQVKSPREYNFDNDEIQTQTEFDETQILLYIFNNIEKFDEYCKNNLTSRDGFCSFYPNNAKAFLKEMKNIVKQDNFYNILIDFITCESVDAEKIEQDISDFILSNF